MLRVPSLEYTYIIFCKVSSGSVIPHNFVQGSTCFTLLIKKIRRGSKSLRQG